MAKPVHSMIRVLDEAKSLDFYTRAFALEIADRLFRTSPWFTCATRRRRSNSN
jgi:hypothetical protein